MFKFVPELKSNVCAGSPNSPSVVYEAYGCKCGAFQDMQKRSVHTTMCSYWCRIIFDFRAEDLSALEIKVILSDRG